MTEHDIVTLLEELAHELGVPHPYAEFDPLGDLFTVWHGVLRVSFDGQIFANPKERWEPLVRHELEHLAAQR